MKKCFISTVKGHEGPCRPVWVNDNKVYSRLDAGVTGFFKSVKFLFGFIPYKYGEEFHGIVRKGNTVEATFP